VFEDRRLVDIEELVLKAQTQTYRDHCASRGRRLSLRRGLLGKEGEVCRCMVDRLREVFRRSVKGSVWRIRESDLAPTLTTSWDT
jgi:hypothetical protein